MATMRCNRSRVRRQLSLFGFFFILFVYLFQLHRLQRHASINTSAVSSPSWSISAQHSTALEDFFLPSRISSKTKARLITCTTENKKISFPRVPDFIIIGTQKGGTTALSALLHYHPSISSSNTFEPHFFDKHGIVLTNRDKLEDPEILCKIRATYARTYFSLQTLMLQPQLTFEKTPSYMLTPTVAKSVSIIAPWAKIIVTLRNPVDRCFSHYKMNVERQQENRTFEEVLGTDLEILKRKRYTIAANDPFPQTHHHGKELRRMAHYFKFRSLLYRGMYVEQLKEWLQYYTLNETIMVIRYERFDQEPVAVLSETLNFIGAPAYNNFSSDLLEESYSPNFSNTSLVLKNETRSYLQQFYQPYNDELADLLGEEWRGVWNEGRY